MGRRAGMLLAAVFMAGPVGVTATAPAAPRAGVLYGVTVDRITKLPAIVSALSGLPERPITRVYFEPHEPASHYAGALSQIHAVSAVMGELLDSSDERSISVGAFDAHVREYLARLAGSVDVWEVGNEVNGNWTGPYPTVAEKLTEAYGGVAAAGGTSALTMYENAFGPDHCGDGAAELTPVQFSERYVPAAVREGLGYVLLSYYPTQCGDRMPGDAALATQLEELHVLYPQAQLGFGEVGLPHAASKRTAAEAKAIMRWAYSLDPSLPYYVGGYFWWYGWEDALKPGARLAGTLDEAFGDEAAALG